MHDRSKDRLCISASAAVGHELVALVERPVLEHDDALRRTRRPFPCREHLGLSPVESPWNTGVGNVISSNPRFANGRPIHVSYTDSPMSSDSVNMLLTNRVPNSVVSVNRLVEVEWFGSIDNADQERVVSLGDRSGQGVVEVDPAGRSSKPSTITGRF